ncbi:glucosaminidase domain-containing protein [Lactococcus termiticola]|uniref:glucosaminidase domain-containing protein n=1 Tax=Lactococcus termiticola TaxID=2169526 RepID=UPI00350E5116
MAPDVNYRPAENFPPIYVTPAYPDYSNSSKITSIKGLRLYNKIAIVVPPVTSVNNTTVDAFIKSLGARVAQLASQNNLYASIILAQAILESGHGTSEVALKGHDLFNIRGSYDGKSITIGSGAYRAYGSYDQSLVDYVKLILNGTDYNKYLYAGAWKSRSKSVEEALDALQGVFATDPSYKAKLIAVINEYDLTKYDNVSNLSSLVKDTQAPTSPLMLGANDSKFPVWDGVDRPGSSSYAWGNCTIYVYNRILQLGGKIGQYMGNGGDWGASAVAQGYYTTHTPQVGYAVSFPPGVAGAVAVYGHVAFVEKVYADGSYLVSEMNVKGLNVVDYRVIPASQASLATYIQPK